MQFGGHRTLSRNSAALGFLTVAERILNTALRISVESVKMNRQEFVDGQSTFFISLPQIVPASLNRGVGGPGVALAEGVGDGRITTGQLVLMEAMGGGFTWGAALARF